MLNKKEETGKIMRLQITRLTPLLCLLSLPFNFLANATEVVPVVAVNDAGEVVEFAMEKPTYIAQMKATTEAVNDSVLPSLTSKASPWMLRTVVVGLGLGIEIGLGPVIQLKGTHRFRLVYSNSIDPVVP